MSKLITAPDGSLFRASYIVSVSPLFGSFDLGTDAFAVYVAGIAEPYLFTAPPEGDGPKAMAKRKARTAKLHAEFIKDWTNSIEGCPSFSEN